MKLKLVVASMSVLGLISCPVLAQAAAQTKHKHHHKTTHVVEKHEYKGEYKDMGALEVCPRVDGFTMMLDVMSHNIGRAKPTVHCMDPISFAGGINFDSKWGSRSIGYMGENTRRLSLNDAYLNVYGIVNEWTDAFLSLSYSQFSGVGDADSHRLAGLYSNAYTPDRFTVEQGFITFKNMNVMPIFVRLGKEFEDFGRYQIHPITETLAQTLTESLHTTAQIGFITPMGLYGSAYTFNNQLRKATVGHNQPNYGAALGFAMPNDQLGWDIGVGYMNDFTGVNDVGYAVATFNGSNGNAAGDEAAQSGQNGTYVTRVSAGTLYGNLNTGPFSFALRYVSAFSKFNIADLGNNILPVAATRGAKPWAGDLTAGFGFNGWNRLQNIYLGYQASGDAVAVFLPRSRWMAGWNVEVWNRTNLGLQWDHDLAYSAGKGGVGGTSNLVTFRAAVQFG